MELDGQAALVSGGAGGLGVSIAERLARAGARVVLADVDEKRLARAQSQLEGIGLAVETLQMDVTRVGEMGPALTRAENRVGPIRVLVNAAGINIREPAEAVSEEHWDAIINVNLKGSFFCAQAVARRLLELKLPGSIVNLGSTESEGTIPMLSVYAISKGGVAQLTRALAVEWAPHGIRVNAVCPAYVETPLTHKWLEDPRRRDVFLSRTPMGRFGRPEEVAEAVLFLASPRSSYVTGHLLYVDGGWNAL
ncbi:MAG: glucose 1-dehydrogenase [Bacillota bacterium]